MVSGLYSQVEDYGVYITKLYCMLNILTICIFSDYIKLKSQVVHVFLFFIFLCVNYIKLIDFVIYFNIFLRTLSF